MRQAYGHNPSLSKPTLGDPGGACLPLSLGSACRYRNVDDVDTIKAALLKGRSVREVVRETGASISTTAAVRKALVEEGAL